jgi:hypothetical protein
MREWQLTTRRDAEGEVMAKLTKAKASGVEGVEGHVEGHAASGLDDRARAPSANPYLRRFTDEVVDRICAARAAGSTWVGACAAEKLTYQGLMWAAKQRPDVAERMAVADGRGAEWYRERIADPDAAGREARDDWRRWAWLAERSHRTAFPRPKEEQTVAIDVQQRVAQLTAPEMRDAVADAVAADAELVAVLLPRLLEHDGTRALITNALASFDVPSLAAEYEDAEED